MNHGATTPDDIPPVHVLEAAHRQERKETEDLLAGFDRPGREPKLPAAERDFVDHYMRKKDKDARTPKPGEIAPAAHASGRHDKTVPRRSSQKNISTVILPRNEGLPSWAVWVGAALFMLLVGGGLAYVATSDAPRGGPAAATGPSAATTISAATTPAMRTTADIPPPPPASETGSVASTTTTMIVESAPAPVATDPPPPPRATTSASGRRRDPHAGSSAPSTLTAPPGPASTHDRSKPPPRDDFIRDM